MYYLGYPYRLNYQNFEHQLPNTTKGMLRQNFSTHSLPPVSNMLVNYRQGNSNVKQIPPTSFLARANSGSVVNTNWANNENRNSKIPTNVSQSFISSSSCFDNNNVNAQDVTVFETSNSLNLKNNYQNLHMIKAQPGNVPLSDSDEKLDSEVDEDEEEDDDQPNPRWAMV